MTTKESLDLAAKAREMDGFLAVAFAEILDRQRDEFYAAVRIAVNNHCTCGGGGPDDGCPACRVYHDLPHQ